MMFDIELCENKLGYVFKNKKLLTQCFTHSSYANEHKEFSDNERLEFFGDAILGFIVTEYLFCKYGLTAEGVLTKKKQEIVSKEPLSRCIMSLELDKHLILGEGEQHNTKNKKSLSENLFEAIVCGIYLDSGIDEAKNFVYDKLLKEDKSTITKSFNDYKSEFQVFVQKMHLGSIEYQLLEQSGPPHQPKFKVAVMLNEKKIAEGSGPSKKSAEQCAAAKAIKIIKDKE